MKVTLRETRTSRHTRIRRATWWRAELLVERQWRRRGWGRPSGGKQFTFRAVLVTPAAGVRLCRGVEH